MAQINIIFILDNNLRIFGNYNVRLHALPTYHLIEIEFKKEIPSFFCLGYVFLSKKKTSITLQSSMLSQAIVIDLTSSQLPSL